MSGYGQMPFGHAPYGLEASDLEALPVVLPPLPSAGQPRIYSSGYGIGPFGSFPYGYGGGETSIFNWKPARESELQRLDPIEFDITNPAWELSDIKIRLVFSNGLTESIWADPAGFAEGYKRGSARSPIAYGYHYVLRRTGGWPTPSFQILVQALDVAGDNVTGQSA